MKAAPLERFEATLVESPPKPLSPHVITVPSTFCAAKAFHVEAITEISHEAAVPTQRNSHALNTTRKHNIAMARRLYGFAALTAEMSRNFVAVGQLKNFALVCP